MFKKYRLSCKELANYKIDELLIEKENLEDAFLNYYENNKEEV